jgi:hypothetical protein
MRNKTTKYWERGSVKKKQPLSRFQPDRNETITKKKTLSELTEK